MLEINNQAHVVEATKYECIGQAFAIIGMSIAKASLGAFLLRLVVVPWHRIAIWTMMMIVVCASVGESCRKLDDEIPWRFSADNLPQLSACASGCRVGRSSSCTTALSRVASAPTPGRRPTSFAVCHPPGCPTSGCPIQASKDLTEKAISIDYLLRLLLRHLPLVHRPRLADAQSREVHHCGIFQSRSDVSSQPCLPPTATRPSMVYEHGELIFPSAAAAGIVRTKAVEGLYKPDYLSTLIPCSTLLQALVDTHP